MPGKIKDSDGIWRNLSLIKLKDSAGTWRNISKAYLKDAFGIWRIWFGKPGPQIDFPLEIFAVGTVHPETLTGTNYHWDSGNVFTYKFQKVTV